MFFDENKISEKYFFRDKFLSDFFQKKYFREKKDFIFKLIPSESIQRAIPLSAHAPSRGGGFGISMRLLGGGGKNVSALVISRGAGFGISVRLPGRVGNTCRHMFFLGGVDLGILGGC